MTQMLLEALNDEVVEYSIITEGSGQNKQYYIDGIWMQSEIVNQNGRKYQRNEFEEQINSYNVDKIPNRRGVGELDHPEGTGINMHRISHIFETPLILQKNDILGRARVLDTAYGKTLKVIISEGLSFGMSSRGTGKLVRKDGFYQVEGFKLSCPGDIVWNNSAPGALAKPIIEMIMAEDKRMEEIVKQELLDETRKIIRSSSSTVLTRKILDQYNKIMESIS